MRAMASHLFAIALRQVADAALVMLAVMGALMVIIALWATVLELLQME